MRKSIGIILGLVLLVACFGCGGGGETLQKVTLNEVTHSVFYAPQYAAIELGFFEDEGLEIELVNGGGADKSMTALLSGDADFALMGPEAAIYVQNGDYDDTPKIIAQLTQTDGSFLVSRQAEEDFSWDDLRGKSVIGGRVGGVPLMTLEHVLRQNGLNPGANVDVITNVQFNLMGGAFAAGEGDYVTLFEPTASEFEAQGKGFIVASVGEAAGDVAYTCYMTRQSTIKRDPDLVRRFLRAIGRAQEWIAEADAAEVAKAIAPSFPDTDESTLTSVVERYRSIDAWRPDPSLNAASLKNLMDIMIESGELDAPCDIDALYDGSLAP